MISLDDAARQIAGAWRMAFGEKDWRNALDRSIDAVFASFAAFLVAAPLVALFTISAKQAAARAPDFSDSIYLTAPLLPLVVGDLLIFAADWAASLLMLILIARATGAGRHAADLIVGYNWIQPVIAAAQLPAIAVIASTASMTAGALLGLPAFLLTIFLIWGILRRGLAARRAPAAAILVALIALGAVINMVGSVVMTALLSAQS